MKLADVCIQRPVFATMLVAALVVVGLASYGQLGVDLFPKVDLPNIVISTRFPGAGPEEVETQITKVLEEAVNTVEGIDELRSSSFEGLSQVVVVFKLHRDPDECAQDVRDRIGRVVGQLPEGVDAPIIEKFDPDAAPVLTVVCSSPRPIRDLTLFAKKQIKEALESVSGVGQIRMVGGREREIHVHVDADKLRAHGVTPLDVKRALQNQNVEVPGGLVETGRKDLVLRTMGRIEHAGEFANIVVKEVGGSLVRIGDVAVVQDSQQEQRSVARLNGRNAVGLIVQKQSGTNTVAVVAEVKKRLETLRQGFPADIEVSTVRDQSRFILASFHAVMEHLILGAIMASLVVLLFLGDFRTTIMVALSIPTSIIATFAVMRYEGFTLNNLSLLALSLAVGLVIDDAIVVHENAFRHFEELGKDRKTATHDAADEIGLAVMATTFSLVVIFVPVAFLPGIVGRFLKTFGLTMVFAILVSLLVSFTLTPMLCAHFLKRKEHGGGHKKSWFDRLIGDAYMLLLRFSMRRRWAIVLTALLCVLSTVPLMKAVSKDFIPLDDQSEYLVNIKGPEGTSLAATLDTLTAIEKEIEKHPGVKLQLTTIGEQAGSGAHEGQIYVGLADLHERKESQFELMARTRKLLKEKFPELRSSVGVVPALSGGGFKQVDLNLTFQGPDLAQLRKYADAVVGTMKDIPGVVDIDTSLSFGKPELRVVVDRVRAASLGVDLFDVASTLRTLVGGDEENVTRYKDEQMGEEFEVRVRTAEQFRNRPEDVAKLPIKARDGVMDLGAVADVHEGTGPLQIDRYNRQRQVSIYANLVGIGLGEAQERVDAKLRTLTFGPGYSHGYLGRSKTFREQQQGFMTAFLLSTVFMYMILAAQFESFIHPVTILLSLPLCIPFAVLSLLLTGTSLHLYSTLGLFMLFGIVKKNAILQIDYTNTLRERGMERHDAILEANHTRLRPILMTTFTLVAGMLPMAVGTGPGAASRAGLAIVVIGGQMLCLLITLLITPVAYSIFDDIVNSGPVQRLLRILD